MFTVCPKCSLKLVVTAADLRVAQGYVRCGRCTNVFNALIGLSDEQQAVLARETAALESGEAQRPAGEASPAGRDEHPAAAETVTDAALEFDPSQTDVSEVFIEPQLGESGETGNFESIVLRSEDEPAPEPAPEQAPEPSRAAPASPAREAAAPEPGRTVPATQTGAPPAGRPARGGERTPGERLAGIGTRATQAAARAPQAPARAPQAPPQGPARPQTPARVPQTRADAHTAAPRGTPQPPRTAAPDTQEFEFEPFMHETRPPARDGAVVPLTRGSSPPAAIVREAAKKFIQTRRAGQPAPAERQPAASPGAPRRASSLRDAETMDSLGPAALPPPAADSAAVAPALLDRMLPAAVAALGLAFVAQIANHYRSELAEVSWLRPPLTALYAALGMPLAPQWDVSAYEVHQLGAVAGEAQPGTLTVRASIKNTASSAQPLPLLRVIVQDRFGNRVAARDVPPRAYLPAASSAHRELAAGQRVDAEVQLVDPGPSAVGFEIDACLAAATGRVSCANEANETAASSER